MVAQQAAEKLPPARRAFLKEYWAEYLTGVLYPDAVLDDIKTAAHGVMLNKYVTKYRELCKNNDTSGPCGARLAFFMGALAHIVADARFDSRFVGKDAANKGQAPPPDSVPARCPGFSAASGSGKGGDGNRAEGFTDETLDICLAKSLNPKGAYLSSIQNNGKVKIGCGKGTFFDPRGLDGECWACPKNHPVRTAFAVTSEKACVNKVFGDKFSKAESKYNFIYFDCPKGYTNIHMMKASGLCIKISERLLINVNKLKTCFANTWNMC